MTHPESMPVDLNGRPMDAFRDAPTDSPIPHEALFLPRHVDGILNVLVIIFKAVQLKNCRIVLKVGQW